MDYSRGIQTIREETEKVKSQWGGLYHSIKESSLYILFVFCVSKILYIIMSVLYKIISFRKSDE